MKHPRQKPREKLAPDIPSKSVEKQIPKAQPVSFKQETISHGIGKELKAKEPKQDEHRKLKIIPTRKSFPRKGK